MTPSRAKRFQRLAGQRRYRRLFVLVTEGQKTEPAYFGLFDGRNQVHVQILPTKGASAPGQLLRVMQRHLKGSPLRERDEAWIVVDTDAWLPEQLAALFEWCAADRQRGVAVSNPMFEYWLLLHFEDGDGIAGARECRERLAHHLPNYDKAEPPLALLEPRIQQAVERARRRDTPPCEDWPRRVGTTVYRLVERMCDA